MVCAIVEGSRGRVVLHGSERQVQRALERIKKSVKKRNIGSVSTSSILEVIDVGPHSKPRDILKMVGDQPPFRSFLAASHDEWDQFAW